MRGSRPCIRFCFDVGLDEHVDGDGDNRCSGAASRYQCDHDVDTAIDQYHHHDDHDVDDDHDVFTGPGSWRITREVPDADIPGSCSKGERLRVYPRIELGFRRTHGTHPSI